MLKQRFFDLLKTDNTDDDKYDKLIKLIDDVKCCPRCHEYLLKEQFDSQLAYCKTCSRKYHREYQQKVIEKSINKENNTRNCKCCKQDKDVSEFYPRSLSRCKVCFRERQKKYSKKYYHDKVKVKKENV